MEVQLLFAPKSDEATNILYSACRQCYYSGFIGDIYPPDSVDTESKEKLITRVVNSGHHSVLEHVSFTFGIKNLSRAAAQQLTRHRIGVSFSMQSMRYCDVGDMNYSAPESVLNNSEAREIYEQSIKIAAENYNKLISLGIPKEDARGVLPLNWNSNLVMTMNCREILHFLSERLCTQTQKEIREMAQRILKICRERIPAVFKKSGPKCEVHGYCNEGTRSCHRYPLKEYILNYKK